MSPNWSEPMIESSDGGYGAEDLSGIGEELAVESSDGGYGEEDLSGGEELEESYTDDSEGLYARARQRRARQLTLERAARRRALARRRNALARRMRSDYYRARPTPSLRGTQAAVAKVDLDNRVQDDKFSAALAAQANRIDRSNLALAATTVVEQAKESFPTENKLINAALNGAPNLLLKTRRQRPGLEGIITSPQFLGAALVAGIAAVGELTQNAKTVEEVEFTELPPGLAIAQGQSATLRAVALNNGDKEIRDKSRKIEWKSDNGNITLDPLTGAFTSATAGASVPPGSSAIVTASVDGKSAQVRLTVR